MVSRAGTYVTGMPGSAPSAPCGTAMASSVSADPPNARRSMSTTWCPVAPSFSATRRAAASSTTCRCPYRKLSACAWYPSWIAIASTVAESRPPLSSTTALRPLANPCLSADPDSLDVAELADAVLRQLPTVPRVLHAAERQRRVGGDHPVDEHLSGIQVGGEPLLLVRVGGPRVRAEAEAGGVGEADRLRVGVHPVEAGDRAEDLLGPHAHRGVQVGDDGRRVEPARAVGHGTPAKDPAAAGRGVVHLSGHPVPAGGGGQRPDVGAVSHRIAHRKRGHARDECGGELIIDVGVHDEPLRRDAGLAVVLAAGGD